MKVLGADIAAFFESEWPEDYYVDDSNKTVINGKIFYDTDASESNPLPLDEKYNLSDFGYLCFYSEKGPTLASFYEKWKKSQATITLIVDVPKEKELELSDYLKIAGARIR